MIAFGMRDAGVKMNVYKFCREQRDATRKRVHQKTTEERGKTMETQKPGGKGVNQIQQNNVLHQRVNRVHQPPCHDPVL